MASFTWKAVTAPTAPRARLKMWMKVSGANRFLRVLVDRKKADSDVDFMGSIGHELQHAIEALSQSSIRDGAQLYNFFKTRSADR